MRNAGRTHSARLALPLVLAAAALVGGCGANDHAAGVTAASSGPPQARAKASATSASPVTSAAADSHAAPPVIAEGRLVRTFTGTTSTGIGSISEPRPLVIRWTAAKPPIQIYTSHGNLLLSSPRRGGVIKLGRGEYPKLRIATNGHWTIQLRAVA
jgi:hypothetical protein